MPMAHPKFCNFAETRKMPNQCKKSEQSKSILAESWHILSLEKYGKTETETKKYDIFSVSKKSLSYFSINTNTENLLAANGVSFCPLV